MAKLSRNKKRINKHNRVKAKLNLTTGIRLSVYKSLKNLYAQLVEVETGKTLSSVSTLNLGVYGGNVKAAEQLGVLLANKIKELNLLDAKIVFDRSGYIYHGRVKAFAEAVRNEGVKF
ncbi:50S ribosomal protein L18 [Mesomycoplasma neurolyticum]|uniref:Large ribosomal subunit protein uL18 n=1 Tax=Mesomycoplasma neurolyticum TaxID=2120 RepID=A0A449A691_9BACT|nr:50S ribosomal protein L18 [Mesomycoplasma neurolyticum]VEU59742.1 50S ribosomal protein L18 [Mesomycoplasma neurolyticum]